MTKPLPCIRQEIIGISLIVAGMMWIIISILYLSYCETPNVQSHISNIPILGFMLIIFGGLICVVPFNNYHSPS